MYIKIKSSLIKIKNWLIFKRDLRIIKRNFKINTNKKGYSYKIVETKKQKGNKTIIIRKRVPFYFDINSYKSDLNNINGVFYLSEKDRNTEESNHYFLVKKSIWDFPIEDKKFSDFVFFLEKIKIISLNRFVFLDRILEIISNIASLKISQRHK